MRTIRWRQPTCTLVIALSIAGCGNGDDEQAEEPAVTVTQPLLDGFTDLMYGGDGTKIMTGAPLSSSVCYLNGVRGTLKNTTTSLQQVFVTDSSNGTYWVGGSTSETLSKALNIHCLTGRTGITRSQYTTYYWTTGARDPAPVDMGPASDRVCLLTKVEGWFNGPGEEVRVRVSNGRWLLDGKQGDLHPYSLGAGAVCIRGVTSAEYSREYSVTSSATGRTYAMLEAPYNDPWAFHYCGLTRINGKFIGKTTENYASVWKSSSGWLVDTRGVAGAVTVGARCIKETALP